jgi:hypothetical protein
MYVYHGHLKNTVIYLPQLILSASSKFFEFLDKEVEVKFDGSPNPEF